MAESQNLEDHTGDGGREGEDVRLDLLQAQRLQIPPCQGQLCVLHLYQLWVENNDAIGLVQMPSLGEGVWQTPWCSVGGVCCAAS